MRLPRKIIIYLKKITVVRNAYNLYRQMIERQLDKEAVGKFLKEKSIERIGKIRVGFILQYLPAWNKSKPIFEELIEDNRFEVYLFCVPSWYGDEKILVENKDNDVFEKIYKKYSTSGAGVINTMIGHDKWVDLKRYNVAYLFYTRPYNRFMPIVYRSYKTSEYTKVCITQYGFSLSKIFYNGTYNLDFFRYCYCLYADTKEEESFINQRIATMHMDNYQRATFLGYPALKDLIVAKEENSEIWNFSQNPFRVIWTPRWSADESIGGSNFLKYKDFLLKYAKERTDIDFLFRPHPLTFGNFIKTDEMTDEDLIIYKNDCNRDNTRLDETSEYYATFWQSSVLLTDYSTIIAEYFATGKPIIFCNTENGTAEPTEAFKKILSICYIADSENDIKKYLDMLKNGKDPMKTKRLKMIREVFCDDIMDAPRRIKEDIVTDYLSNGGRLQ